jgi:hypothetical protein
MTIGAFMARQPLKTRLLARRSLPTARLAERFLIVFALLAGLGVGGVLFTSSLWALFPFVVAAPLAVQQFALDISTRGRSLTAELAGAAAISSSVAVAAIAGGLSLPSAMALWAVLVGRFIPSILYVRNRLLLEKGKKLDRISPNVAHAASFLIVAGLAVLGLASFLTVGVFAILLVRSIYGLTAKGKGTKAMVIGIREVAFGVLTVLSIIAGYYAGF